MERYCAQQQTRGLAEATITARERELQRFGIWLKSRRPKPSLEGIDAEQVTRYVEARSAFHSRSTVASVFSHLRSMGEFLVEERVWRANPLRWMRGPKMHLHRPLPRRIDREHQQSLWTAAEARPQEHARYQAICVLALLYGTGLRRGELERLDLGHWDRASGLLTIDGRKTGAQRKVPAGRPRGRIERLARIGHRGGEGRPVAIQHATARRREPPAGAAASGESVRVHSPAGVLA